MSEIIKNTERKNSILDFGCGFSHLYKYEFKKKKAKIDYIGIDAVKSHINYCKKKYPENEYFNCTLENFFPKKKYDYIFANGVFTVKRELTTKSMDIYVYKSLLRLFKICKIGIAVNFMSINVDWRRRDLFYLSIDKLIKFVTKKLTKKFIIRNDYNLYEYTIYIFKK